MSDEISKEMIEKGTVVDVRTYEEISSGMFENAIHIPLNELLIELDQFKSFKTPLILYCRSGNRSGQAVGLLEDEGLTGLFNGINKEYLESLSS
jgi:phage shock protein E